MSTTSTRFCIHCGKKIPPDTVFCPYCGTKQTNIKSNNQNNNNNNNNNNNDSTTNTTTTNSSNTRTEQSTFSDTAHNKVDKLMNMKQDTEREEQENAQQEESLSLQEQTYINNKVNNEAPSTVATYLLGIFLFDFGAPQWYLHHNIAGAIILIDTFILSWILGLGLIINGIWWFIDLFLYPLYIRHNKAKIKRDAINNVLLMRHE